MIKKLLLLICLILCLNACGHKSNVEILDEMVSLTLTEFDDVYHLSSYKQWDPQRLTKVTSCVSRLGLNKDTVNISETELNEFFDNSSAEDLLEALYWIKNIGSPILDPQGMTCLLQMCDDLKIFVPMTAFYSNADRPPNTKTETIKGKFNNPWNYNSVYEETRETNYTSYYYGEFEVLIIDGWKYDSGDLGWRNGKFYDIPSRWIQRKETICKYRGSSLSADLINKDTITMFNKMSREQLEEMNFYEELGFYFFSGVNKYVIKDDQIERL